MMPLLAVHSPVWLSAWKLSALICYASEWLEWPSLCPCPGICSSGISHVRVDHVEMVKLSIGAYSNASSYSDNKLYDVVPTWSFQWMDNDQWVLPNIVASDFPRLHLGKRWILTRFLSCSLRRSTPCVASASQWHRNWRKRTALGEKFAKLHGEFPELRRCCPAIFGLIALQTTNFVFGKQLLFYILKYDICWKVFYCFPIASSRAIL